jgi:DNA-binding PadR family transcriptional regulator
MALAHAVLAILVREPSSGYDLAKQFEGSVGFFWKATFQQIYRELARLEAQGLLSVETIQQSHYPAKKCYTVTESGQEYLRQWIEAPVEVSPLKDDLLVKLYSGYLVPLPTVLAELQRHRSAHQERLAVYQELEKKYFEQPESLDEPARFVYITLRSGVHAELAQVAWCDETIAFLARKGTEEGVLGLI